MRSFFKVSFNLIGFLFRPQILCGFLLIGAKALFDHIGNGEPLYITRTDGIGDVVLLQEALDGLCKHIALPFTSRSKQAEPSFD